MINSQVVKEVFGIDLPADLRSAKVGELKQSIEGLLGAQKKLLDSADLEKRDLSESEGQGFDESNSWLDSATEELKRRPSQRSNELLKLFGGHQEREKSTPWNFGEVGLSYEQLHHRGVKLGREEEEDIEVFFKNVMSGQFEKRGYFAPERYTSDLMSKAQSTSIVLPRVRQYPIDGIALHVAMFDDQDQSAGFWAGTEVQWKPEDGEFTDVDPQDREIVLKPRKAGIFCSLTREIVEDSPSVAGILGPKLSFSIGQAVDEACLIGNGVNRPLGVVNSPATIQVSRSAANAIDYTDIINMYSRVHPAFIRDAIWVAHPSVAPQLLGMTNAGGTDYIWLPNAASGAATAVPQRLLGLELHWSDKLSELGTAGDLILCDFSMYAFATRKGITVERSNAPGWYRDRISFRAIMRADGQPLLSKPIKPRVGTTTLSAFVMLAD